MKKLHVLMKTFIVIFCILLTFCFSNWELAVNAAVSYDEKIYSTVNLNENFDDDTVIIIMDKSISVRNKEYDTSFFGQILLKK